MPQTRTCDYCGDDIEPGTGTMFVHVDGTTVHYCSAKCEKNADLGREPRDVAWTEEGQAGADVETEAEEIEAPEAEEAEAPEAEEAEGSDEADLETGERPDEEPDETETTTTDDAEPDEPEDDEE